MKFGFFKKNSEDSVAFRREMAEKISRHRLRYVTEQTENGDVVIGKEGGCNIRNGEFIVTSSREVVFRAEIDKMKAYELMSLEGAVLEGYDIEHSAYRTVTVYYVYYR